MDVENSQPAENPKPVEDSEPGFILVLGAKGCGKTSFINASLESFPCPERPGAFSISIEIHESVPNWEMTFEFVEAALDDPDPELLSLIRKAQATVLVYALNDSKSLDRVLSKWKSLIPPDRLGKGRGVTLLGCKSDLVKFKYLSRRTIRNATKEIKADFFRIWSSQTKEGLNEVLDDVGMSTRLGRIVCAYPAPWARIACRKRFLPVFIVLGIVVIPVAVPVILGLFAVDQVKEWKQARKKRREHCEEPFDQPILDTDSAFTKVEEEEDKGEKVRSQDLLHHYSVTI